MAQPVLWILNTSAGPKPFDPVFWGMVSRLQNLARCEVTIRGENVTAGQPFNDPYFVLIYVSRWTPDTETAHRAILNGLTKTLARTILIVKAQFQIIIPQADLYAAADPSADTPATPDISFSHQSSFITTWRKDSPEYLSDLNSHVSFLNTTNMLQVIDKIAAALPPVVRLLESPKLPAMVQPSSPEGSLFLLSFSEEARYHVLQALSARNRSVIEGLPSSGTSHGIIIALSHKGIFRDWLAAVNMFAVSTHLTDIFQAQQYAVVLPSTASSHGLEVYCGRSFQKWQNLLPTSWQHRPLIFVHDWDTNTAFTRTDMADKRILHSGFYSKLDPLDFVIHEATNTIDKKLQAKGDEHHQYFARIIPWMSDQLAFATPSSLLEEDSERERHYVGACAMYCKLLETSQFGEKVLLKPANPTFHAVRHVACSGTRSGPAATRLAREGAALVIYQTILNSERSEFWAALGSRDEFTELAMVGLTSTNELLQKMAMRAVIALATHDDVGQHLDLFDMRRLVSTLADQLTGYRRTNPTLAAYLTFCFGRHNSNLILRWPVPLVDAVPMLLWHVRVIMNNSPKLPQLRIEDVHHMLLLLFVLIRAEQGTEHDDVVKFLTKVLPPHWADLLFDLIELHVDAVASPLAETKHFEASVSLFSSLADVIFEIDVLRSADEIEQWKARWAQLLANRIVPWLRRCAVAIPTATDSVAVRNQFRGGLLAMYAYSAGLRESPTIARILGPPFLDNYPSLFQVLIRMDPPDAAIGGTAALNDVQRLWINYIAEQLIKDPARQHEMPAEFLSEMLRICCIVPPVEQTKLTDAFAAVEIYILHMQHVPVARYGEIAARLLDILGTPDIRQLRYCCIIFRKLIRHDNASPEHVFAAQYTVGQLTKLANAIIMRDQVFTETLIDVLRRILHSNFFVLFTLQEAENFPQLVRFLITLLHTPVAQEHTLPVLSVLLRIAGTAIPAIDLVHSLLTENDEIASSLLAFCEYDQNSEIRFAARMLVSVLLSPPYYVPQATLRERSLRLVRFADGSRMLQSCGDRLHDIGSLNRLFSVVTTSYALLFPNVFRPLLDQFLDAGVMDWLADALIRHLPALPTLSENGPEVPLLHQGLCGYGNALNADVATHAHVERRAMKLMDVCLDTLIGLTPELMEQQFIEGMITACLTVIGGLGKVMDRDVLLRELTPARIEKLVDRLVVKFSKPEVLIVVHATLLEFCLRELLSGQALETSKQAMMRLVSAYLPTWSGTISNIWPVDTILEYLRKAIALPESEALLAFMLWILLFSLKPVDRELAIATNIAKFEANAQEFLDLVRAIDTTNNPTLQVLVKETESHAMQCLSKKEGSSQQ